MKQISGLHLLMDGFVNDSETLEPGNICDLFDRLVEALDMQYLLRPIAMRVPLDPKKLLTNEDEGGWSVICQITTSHIALHGWPSRNAFMLDCFSCCPFDVNKAISIIKNMLNVKDAKYHIIERKGPEPQQLELPSWNYNPEPVTTIL